MNRTLNIHKVKNQKMCLKLEKSMWRKLFGGKIKALTMIGRKLWLKIPSLG